MDEKRINIRVENESVSARATRQRSKGRAKLMIGGGILVVAGICLSVMMLPEADRKPQSSPAEQIAPAIIAAAPEEIAAVEAGNFFPDDGQSMWASPTDGRPIDTSYLLAGTQLILHARVSDLLGHSEGERVQAALGPWGEQISQQITKTMGVPLSDVETLLVGVRPTRGDRLEFAMRLGLKSIALDSDRPDNCFMPTESKGKILVACSPTALAELKSQGDASPLFPREMQRILQRSDSARMATVLFAGKFLQINGEKLLYGSSEPLRAAIIDFLGDAATASAISAHWGENFFLELRSTVSLNERPHRLADQLAQRVTDSSDRIENAILSEPLHPYSRKVLARFPAMMRKLGNYTRSSEEEGLSLLRCYLPRRAGHNLLMATELMLNSPEKLTDASVTNLASAGRQHPEGLSERLQQSTSLVFPKETLQKALEILSGDIGVPIEIAGRDLQLEGITKNQSFAIELRDRPAAEILLAVLLRANPDQTAAGASDIKQKLVYVVREPIGDQPGAIVVTTRKAAHDRGEKLPTVFEPPVP